MSLFALDDDIMNSGDTDAGLVIVGIDGADAIFK
jgi:hypothetical protein